MSSPRCLLSRTGATTPGLARLVRASLLLLFTYVFLANAWMGDDAYITFRTVWNFIHGYGLTYNPDERVQAYTDPLWMLVIAAAHLVTGEFFFTVTALSWIFNVAAGIVLLRRARSLQQHRAARGLAGQLEGAHRLHVVGPRVSAELFSHRAVLRRAIWSGTSARRSPTAELRFFVLIAALAFVTRLDTVLLFALPVGEMVVRTLRARGRQAVWPIVVGGRARRALARLRDVLLRVPAAEHLLRQGGKRHSRHGCCISRAGRICSTASATIRSRSAPSRSRRSSRGERAAVVARGGVRAAVRDLHRIGRRRLHERPVFRHAVSRRGDGDRAGARRRRSCPGRRGHSCSTTC